MQFLCSARKWTSKLGMPDCKRLQVLSINFWTTNDQQKGTQINEQTKQEHPKASNSLKYPAH